MKFSKTITASLLLLATVGFAGEREDSPHGSPGAVNLQYTQAIQYTNARSTAEASAKAYGGAAYGGAGGAGGAAYGGAGGAASGGTGNGTVTTQVDTGSKYPNQAPPIFATSSPSFSQRNCTPVGSVTASGPFGGIGVAAPMGGGTCDGLNISDLLNQWIKDTGNQRLWLVECNLMVTANSDLEEAFEKSQYSCQQAYIDRKVATESAAKQELANRQALQTLPAKKAGL